MKTWSDYKNYVRDVDPRAKRDIEEMEKLASIIGAMVEQRKSLGLTQRDLAALCGIPQSSVARIESYRTIPNLETLLLLFSRLGLELNVTATKG